MKKDTFYAINGNKSTEKGNYTMKPGLYHTHNSSLYINVERVHHQNDSYVKFKAVLISKTNNSPYFETYKNYKLPLSQISHWISYNIQDNA